MSAQVHSNVLDRTLPSSVSSRRRPVWRQRLVEIERGFSLSLRGDGALFVHFFSASVVIAAGFTLGVSLVEWSVIVTSLTLVFSAEMFRQMLKSLLQKLGHYFDDQGRAVLRIAAATVVLTAVGATTAVGLIFARAILQLFAA
ncbi:MAG: diacylglycerol kinase family protein [Planctomycetaceae bacterium]